MLDPVDMTTQQRDTLLRRRAVPQRALEGRPPAQHRRRSILRGGRDCGADGDEVIEHVGQLRPQRFDHLTAECVGVMELHDALALPEGIWTGRRRAGVAVDHDHLTAATSERDRDEQAGRTRADDDYSHIGSKLR